MRKLRVVWAALSLAACSALFTAWTWRQTRDLSQSFQVLQDRLEQVGVPLWGGKARIFGAAVRFTGLQRFKRYVTFDFAVTGIFAALCARVDERARTLLFLVQLSAFTALQ